MGKKKTKEQEYCVYSCKDCGQTLSPQETRAFLEGRYAIDPSGDTRQLCNKCKEKYE